jgi:electron transfer flavoprotein beta subunit
MRILTCVKQVREPQSLLGLADGHALWAAPSRHKISACDEFALEEALRLADDHPGTEICCLTVGPAGAEDILRRALGMGATQAVHLRAPEGADPRPATLAQAIAGWARDQGFDLVLTGVMSEDAMRGAVGPMLAELLDLPCATAVTRLEADPPGRMVRAWREIEGGLRQELALPLPALLTIQTSPNQPRYPSLSNLLRAKKTTPLTVDLDLLVGSPSEDGLRFLGLAAPQRRRVGVRLEGSTVDKATALLALLRERGLL